VFVGQDVMRHSQYSFDLQKFYHVVKGSYDGHRIRLKSGSQKCIRNFDKRCLGKWQSGRKWEMI